MHHTLYKQRQMNTLNAVSVNVFLNSKISHPHTGTLMLVIEYVGKCSLSPSNAHSKLILASISLFSVNTTIIEPTLCKSVEMS